MYKTCVTGDMSGEVGCLVLDHNVVLTQVLLGRFSSDIAFLVPTMALLLKRLYNRSDHLSMCTLQLLMRKCVYGDTVNV